MRALDSNGTLWAWPRVEANASAISTESTSRSQYKTSIHEESSIKLMKNASIIRKIKYLAPWNSHVRTAASHVTLRKHNITRARYGVYSAFDTLFPSLFTLVYVHEPPLTILLFMLCVTRC